MTKIAYIIRGLPGSGKTTLAQQLAPDFNVAADEWFDKFNDGKFDPNYLKDAHTWCKNEFVHFCENNEPVVAVHNTFTRKHEYEDYVHIAKQIGYQVFVITTHNHHGSDSLHQVPSDKIEQMRKRFEMNL